MMRAIVYFFRGIGDATEHYAVNVLQSMKNYAQKIIIVCDQPLDDSFAGVLKELRGTSIFHQKCENPLQSYVYGIDQIPGLQEYEEVLCLSDSLMGPLSPPDEIFHQADRWRNSVWGLAFQRQYINGVCEKYLSIDFIAFRKNIFLSRAIFGHIKRLAAQKYVCSDEVSWILSQYLRALGCKMEAHIKEDVYENYLNPFFDCPDVMCKRSPFFWKEAFYTRSPSAYISTRGDDARRCLKTMESNPEFDVNILWDYILKKANIADIHHCLKPDFVLPSGAVLPEAEGKGRSALLMHLYYEDILDVSYPFARNIPPEMDLLITTTSLETKKKIIEMFGDIPCRHFEVRIVSARGRSESALLLGFPDIIFDYDCVCFVHDKKTTQIKPPSVGREFWRMGMNGCLYSREYIQNIIHTFKENVRLGLLSSYPTNVGQYYNILGAYEWAANVENVLQLSEKLGLDPALVDPAKRLLAPFGSFFWARPAALKPLLAYPWKLYDFPAEPVAVDGTLLHAIERIYPFAAQHMGFYSAYAMPDQIAADLIEDFSFQIRSINVQMAGKKDIETFHSVTQYLAHTK